MQLMYYIVLSFLLISLPSCSISTQSSTDTIEKKSYDISNSVNIIMYLIRTDSVADVLEDPTSLDVDILIRNFSPAEIAFEAEVLSCVVPVIVYFHDEENIEHSLVEKLAAQYEDAIKFVVISGKRYFSLVEKAQVEKYPTFILIQNRQEKGRIEGESTRQQLEELLKLSLVKKTQNIPYN